jgi:hypothetical protein
MSEGLYALLLRLFPKRFRDVYAEEALHLFRDRARDERGAIRHLRLWFDLLLDLAVSVPRLRFRERRRVAAAVQRLEGVPGFHVLEGRPPHPAVVMLAVVVSSAVVWAAAFSLTRTAAETPAGASAEEARYPVDAATVKAARGGMQGVPVRDSSANAARGVVRSTTAGNTKQGETSISPREANAGTATAILEAPVAIRSASDGPTSIDEARRRTVIAGAIAKLQESYLDLAMAQKMAAALLVHEEHGDDSRAIDGPDFADLLTGQLQEVSHDKHLRVGYTLVATPARPENPTPEDMARYRSDMARSNCMIASAKMLPHNIAYLKINGFPDPAICASRVAAAMQSLNGASSIIYDLRDNHGGDPHMVALVATYLFARKTHLNDIYSPRSNRTEQFWTMTSPPTGNRLWNKPAYVLTSSRTFSGGEEFCYDLKSLRRATLIGEPTGGGAHLVRKQWIDDNFTIGVPIARPINPITKTDWEGTGVEPDIRVKAEDAMAVAERMAAGRTSRR